jgi:hypothetical protein
MPGSADESKNQSRDNSPKYASTNKRQGKTWLIPSRARQWIAGWQTSNRAGWILQEILLLETFVLLQSFQPESHVP